MTRFARAIGISGLFTVCFFFAGVGCAKTQDVEVEEGPRVVGDQIGNTRWVYLRRTGGPETDLHVGYLRTRVLTFNDGTEVAQELALDKGDRSLGYFQPDGRTFVLSNSGDSPEMIGILPPQQSLSQLFGVEGVFNVVSEERKQ